MRGWPYRYPPTHSDDLFITAFDAAPYIWWFWPQPLAAPFYLHVSIRFLEPFPIFRGIWVAFIAHILIYNCTSPGCYPRHNMYVGFIIMLFILLMFMPALYHLVVFQTPYCLYYCLSGHRYASPIAYSRYSLIKKTCRTYKSPPQGLDLSALWSTLQSSLFDFPVVV